MKKSALLSSVVALLVFGDVCAAPFDWGAWKATASGERDRARVRALALRAAEVDQTYVDEVQAIHDALPAGIRAGFTARMQALANLVGVNTHDDKVTRKGELTQLQADMGTAKTARDTYIRALEDRAADMTAADAAVLRAWIANQAAAGVTYDDGDNICTSVDHGLASAFGAHFNAQETAATNAFNGLSQALEDVGNDPTSLNAARYATISSCLGMARAQEALSRAGATAETLDEAMRFAIGAHRWNPKADAYLDTNFDTDKGNDGRRTITVNGQHVVDNLFNLAYTGRDDGALLLAQDDAFRALAANIDPGDFGLTDYASEETIAGNMTALKVAFGGQEFKDLEKNDQLTWLLALIRANGTGGAAVGAGRAPMPLVDKCAELAAIILAKPE